MKVVFNDFLSIMIHQTDLTLTSYIKAKLAPLNIAPEQNLILMLLWEKDGLTQNEIAKKLEKDKTNIARMICNLEKKGFISRQINEIDNRSFNVFLTENGKKLGEMIKPLAEEFNRTVCAGISKEEQQIVKQVLLKMRQNVEMKCIESK
ncbi:MarR family transcriptional regulator [Paenibacillus sp. BSR1-1]|uniref:MarR family winged helix-turn-helix transcriptional regulator n=1 Tax=Paenibacillus sp. BSR1-1 TaxID=3020845 RepID=UPI0025B24EF5|nr:MarR family transcriptional regulator [Paenibacillus sp. BSR1-1]MDN3015479.1 MarR family transcriptional regulator [Paenibacillus sp. BSR1-1]